MSPHEAIVRVPPEALDEPTLQALLEEFVTRDGTDFSDVDERIADMRSMLRTGRAHIVYDSVSESCNYVLDQDYLDALKT